MKERQLTLATMESCTGGLLASTITDVPGSSGYFLGGFVAYQTPMKIDLGVDPAIVEEFGVISAECAREMARVARQRREASVGIGITGVAGPDEQEGKPAGTIHIAVDAIWAAPQTASYTFAQGRTAVKRRAVTTALVMLRQSLLNYRGEALV
jgi:PncC family amidohydrolase